MKILIVGDSYSENKSELSWPAYVESHFKCQVVNCSRAASSLQYSYLNLTKLLKHTYFEVVVFAITSADRLYHRDMILHRGYPQYNDGREVTKEIKEAIEGYYLHMYDPRNSIIINNMFCRAIAQLSLENPNTKFILLPGFTEFESAILGNCVVTTKPLSYYSMLDMEAHKAEQQGKSVPRLNHLTFFQNKTLANYVIEFIENYTFGSISRFSLDKLEILK